MCRQDRARATRATRLEVPFFFQARMQAADHVNFGHSNAKCLSHDIDNFVNRVFKSVCIAFLGGKSAELAGKNTNIGVVDVTVVDVRGVVAVLLLANVACNDAEGVEIGRAIQCQRFRLGNPLPCLDFFRDRSKFLWNKRVIHPQPGLRDTRYDAHSTRRLQQKAPNQQPPIFGQPNRDGFDCLRR